MWTPLPVLRGYDDVVAVQCEHPVALLKPESCWPSQPVKPFAMLDHTYRALVRKGEEPGLLEVQPPEQVLHLGGRPASGGGFSVPTGATGSRWICPN